MTSKKSNVEDSFPVMLRMQHKNPPLSMQLGTGSILVTSTLDGLFVWNASSAESITSIHDLDPGAHQAIREWDISPDSKYLCTGAADLTTKVYATETGERLSRLSKLRPDYYNSASQICFSPDGHLLATAMGRKVELYSTSNWEQLAELKGHTTKVHLLSMLRDSSLLISAAGRYVKLWDLPAATERMTLPVFKRMLGALVISEDCTMLATATEGGEVSLWNLPQGTLLKTFSSHTSEIFGLAISPDRSLIASSELNGQLHLTRVSDAKTIKRQTPGCGKPVFSPDGKFLAIAADQQTWILRAADGKLLSEIPESSVVAFLDERHMACGDGNAIVVRKLAIPENQLNVPAQEIEKAITATQKESKPRKSKPTKKEKARSSNANRKAKAEAAKPHFWLNVRRELKTVRLFHSKPDRKAIRQEFADLACQECNKVDELAALERGIAHDVKLPPDNIQLAMTDDGILMVSPIVRRVLEDVSGDQLRYFTFPGSSASIAWPMNVLRLPDDAPLRTGSKPQTTVLSLASRRCATCNRPRSITVRPSLGEYNESQMIVGLSLEPGFWFVAHQRIGEGLKSAGITGWRRESFGTSRYL